MYAVKTRDDSSSPPHTFAFQGASKKVTNMEWDKFWSINKKKYEPTAHRYMGIFKDTCVELHIENASAGKEGDIVAIPVALHPKVID